MDQNSNIIAIGSDHAGFKIKEFLKQKLVLQGYKFKDFGTFSEESMDYPDVAHPLAKAIQKGTFKTGILICGSGNGVAMAANKYTGIRAAVCWNEDIVKLARQHNDANILTLPARFIDQEQAVILTDFFLHTNFEGGRHLSRVEKISKTI